MYTSHFTNDDQKLYALLPHLSLLDGVDIDALGKYPGGTVHLTHFPTEDFRFLHEAAGITYHGTLFAAWYNCPVNELREETPIRYRRSTDGGVSWTEPETVVTDPSAKILYCPPVFGIQDDTLYLFVNEMVSADHMHALDLFRWNSDTEAFEMLWSVPSAFKLNTNLVTLPNGKLMLPGRVGALDEFPDIPAVLLSDSGSVHGPWRVVKTASDPFLPDGERYIHPESAVMLTEDQVYLFTRNDHRHVSMVYVSEDLGESWSGPFSHDIPLSGSKIYTGELSDGRHYLIGNLPPYRHKLALFLSEPEEMRFSHGYMLADAHPETLGFGELWHYPVAWEADGNLYVICTVSLGERDQTEPWMKGARGAVLFVLPVQ